MSSIPNRKVLSDITPVKSSGEIDVEKINNLNQEINLRLAQSVPPAQPLRQGLGGAHPVPTLLGGRPAQSVVAEGLKENFSRTLEEEWRGEHDLEEALSRVGGSLHQEVNPTINLRLRRGFIVQRTSSGMEEETPKTIDLSPAPPLSSTEWPKEKTVVEKNFFSSEVAHPRSSERLAPIRSPASRRSLAPIPPETDLWLARAKAASRPSPDQTLLPSYSDLIVQFIYRQRKMLLGGVILLSLVILVFGFLGGGRKLKEVFMKDNYQAVGNLEQAKIDLTKLDFSSAANNFNLAYDNFSQASNRLNFLGSSLISLLSGVGFNKVKSADNLTKAGENIAKAGENLSLALDRLYHTNLSAYLGSGSEPHPSLSASYFIQLFKDALVFSEKRIGTAQTLLAAVDENTIPEQKRQAFLEFRSQVPLLHNFLDQAVNYSDFLLAVVGKNGPKKYLILFQNNSELRPTGGFPGSYALVTFNHGLLFNFTVDDIYNIDGQARKNIVPPRALQHITPLWGVRDANWFLNFPDSARKVMQMYTKNDGGPEVDGVIALTPTILQRILEVVGPIELPEYSKILDSKNFLAEIQEEVEYGNNRVQPKRILVDFAPRLLQRLSEQDQDHWFTIAKIFMAGIEQKHILAYFKDQSLEKVAEDNGLAGKVKEADQDYLLITHSNIKGSKTDAVIDNDYQLKESLTSAGLLEHTLTITRTHRGGKASLGFYNRTSFDYLRVLVPKGSKLLEIKGQSKPNFSPLVGNYHTADYVEDEDLKKYEDQAKTVATAVQQWEESDKTAFGFWLFLSPGETKSITLRYLTPFTLAGGEYLLLAQKQPGLLADHLEISFTAPSGQHLIFKYPENWETREKETNWQGTLEKDLIFGLKWQ